MVVQVCWWCPQYHMERSSQQTAKAPKFHRSTHQIYHRTPRNRKTPLPRYPDQTLSQLHWIHSLQKPNHTWTTTLTTPFQQNYPLSTPSSTEIKRYFLHLNGSPSQSPKRQPLPSTVLSTRQTPTENQQKTKPIHRKVYRRS